MSITFLYKLVKLQSTAFIAEQALLYIRFLCAY